VAAGLVVVSAVPHWSCASAETSRAAQRCPVSTESEERVQVCNKMKAAADAICAVHGHASALCEAAIKPHQSMCENTDNTGWNFLARAATDIGEAENSTTTTQLTQGSWRRRRSPCSANAYNWWKTGTPDNYWTHTQGFWPGIGFHPAMQSGYFNNCDWVDYTDVHPGSFAYQGCQFQNRGYCLEGDHCYPSVSAQLRFVGCKNGGDCTDAAFVKDCQRRLFALQGFYDKKMLAATSHIRKLVFKCGECGGLSLRV